MQVFWAIVWFLGLYLLVAWLVVQAFRKSPYTVPQSCLFFANVLLTRILWRAEVPGALPLAPGQGAVIVANHRSSIDPFFIQLITGRVVHWMVTQRFFSLPLIGGFLKTCESIPTSRSGVDTASTKKAIRLAEKGGIIGMFPEGRINRTRQVLQSVRPGAAMIALKAGVPIIPCYIDGSPFDGTPVGALLMSAHVKLRVGEPIDLSCYAGRENEKEVQAEVMLKAVREIARLAGEEDFEPELAGKTWSTLCR